jgi:hypothetical protein
MSIRTRQTLAYDVTGVNNRFGSYNGGHSIVNYSKTTLDEVQVGDNRQFHVTIRSFDGCKLNAPYWSWAAINWIDYIADAVQYQGVNFGHLALSGVPPVNDLAVTAAARTTPSRPYVDVPVEALQLGDILSLLKKHGDTIFQQLGSYNLEYQFNIKPVVEDLVKIFNFQDQVERRIKEIERLRSRGLRRTIPLGELGDYESLDSGSWNPQSGDYYIVTTYTARTRLQIGAHVRWKPTMDLTTLAPGDIRKLARKAVLGLTFDGSSAWQLIPWSWLIDWGISIGDWFKANRNIIPAELDGLTITKHTKSVYVSNPWSTPYGPTTITLSEGHFIAEDKERIPASPIPIAHFPFLSGNQLGILASLAITGKAAR